MIDVVIAGAGPSGLSAALCLAGVGRQVLVLDGGPWRGASSDAAHNLFTRDGATPSELRDSAGASRVEIPHNLDLFAARLTARWGHLPAVSCRLLRRA